MPSIDSRWRCVEWGGRSMTEDRREGEPSATSTSAGPTVIDVTPTTAPHSEGERAAPPERPSKPRGSVAAIAALAILVLALGTSPYWAPPVASVLPWGGMPDGKEPAIDTAGIEAKLS